MRNLYNRLLAVFTFVITVSGTVCDLPLLEEIAKVFPSCSSATEISRCLEIRNTLKNEISLGECLLNIGCTPEQTKLLRLYLLDTCSADVNQLLRGQDRGDLRKRADDDSSSAAKTTGKATGTTQKTNGKTTAASTTAAQTSAAATSATDDSTTAAASSTSAASTPSSTSAPTTTATSTPTSTTSTPSTTASAASANAPLTCLSTSYLTTTWCVSTTSGASTGTSCFPTTTPTTKCSDGLICFENGGAPTTCMKREDNLTTSGLVVTIFFGFVVASMLTALLWMCCRSRIADRRARKAREALLIAGSNRARQESKADLENRGGSEVHLPLMTAQGPAGGFGYQQVGSNNEYDPYGGGMGRPPTSRHPSGNYQDIVAARAPPNAPPKLHPGLGAVQPGGGALRYDGDDEYEDLGVSRQR